MSKIVSKCGAVTVTEVDADAETYRIDCGRCSERVTYRFEAFTTVEGERHEKWCSKNYKPKVEIAGIEFATAAVAPGVTMFMFDPTKGNS